MNTAHLSSATVGALVAGLSARYGWGVSQDEALAFAAAGLAIGATGLHVLALAYRGPGILGAVRQTLFGAKKPPAA